MGLTCKICLDSATRSMHARITRCGHVFCEPCAKIWFRNEAACPVCRAFVGNLSALISLYDQDTRIHSCNDEDVCCAKLGLHEDNVGGSGSSRRCDRNKENQCDPKNEEEDVQVKYVLGKVADRWQQVMVERAKLKVQVAKLEKVKQDLQAQVVSLTDENKLLKHALGMHLHSAGSCVLDSDPRDLVEAHLHLTASKAAYSDLYVSLAAEARTIGLGRPPVQIEERLGAARWELAHTFSKHSGPVHGIAVSTSGDLVATASWDNVCRLYDVHLEEEVAVLSGHVLGLYAVKFSPVKQDLLGTVSSDQTCRLWSTDTGECVRVLEGHKDEVNGLSFKRGTNLLATASDDTTCIIWDAERGTALTKLKGHRSTVYGVCFQPCGNLLATASFDYTAKLWDVRTAKEVQTLRGHVEDVIGVDIDNSGWLLATGSDDKTCRIWDLRMCTPLAVLQEHSGEVKRIVFSPYGKLLATTSGDTTVRLFDTSTFECLHILSSHSDHVFDVAWSPTADYLVTASHDCLWKLWQPEVQSSATDFM